ncbi:putative ATPase [Krasilnikovia cinnamomea]|uniref:Putative ATPase n=1 Tax=Krasilnikovia cinnamomea TaxID=349313 RepID=A0A4Q7ZUU1_9ACTN|nr:BTAD domain-containing putative transcriptional regulator [Krasilnikovia cinnamomea]RZU54359.1 putative ATPase [Krasilnikovia cinnamomea]
MDRIEVALLGALRVTRDGAPVEVPGARLRGLLVRLALAGGRAVDVAALTGALWPRERPADAGNALQSLVSRLRRVLGSADAVAQAGGGYRLAVGADDVDAVRFERLTQAGRARLRAGEPEAGAALLAQAVALWRGPVAAEAVAVAPGVATRLTQDGTETAADLAEADLALGRQAEAAARLTALLAEEPVHERVAGLLMDALAGLGRQAEALALYDRVRRDLADRLGADPGVALRERHLRLLRGADSPQRAAVATAPPPPASPAPGNLPAPLTTFIAREDDLARVHDLLRGGRLVTVLGPGGAGKTRLALEAARRDRDAWADGTWLVDLAAVTEPGKVAAAVMSALGLRGGALFEQGPARPAAEGRDDLGLLVERLSGRECLLVVDNCEHLIESAAQVTTALLIRCPRLRVLATSREPLAVDGEALVPLGPLGLPPAGADPATAVRAAAVRLFAERAAAVRPGFAVDSSTVDDVVQIVHRLDGLPLALELAAARLRTLPLAELAAGLSDRFRLLTSGSRTALPRHRTLHAVIAWSWDLLGEPERVLAERVAVLPAGVTPGSAAALCADTGIGAGQVPELLTALAERSLLNVAGDGPRYRMLESLREFGTGRLAEQALAGRVRSLAAGHLAALVAEQDARLRTADQLDALRTLRDEYDNALAALRHLCDSGDAAAAVRLALDLCWYWQMFGRRAEAVFWLGEALAVPGPADPVARDCAEAVRTLNAMGTDPVLVAESVPQRHDRLRDLAVRLAAHPELPGLVGALAAVVLYLADEPDAARARIDRLVAGPDRWLSAFARLFRAQLAENEGDVARVRRDIDDALAVFRAVGDRWGQATALPLRALTREYDGDLDGALADLDAARALSREFGSLDVNDEIFLEFRWADVHLRRGEPERATAALAAARARAEHAESAELIVLIDAMEAGISTLRGDLERAATLLERADERVAAVDGGLARGDHGTAILGAVRASLAVARDDPAGAEAALARAYPAAVASRDMPIVAMVAVVAAELADLQGRHADAAALLGAAARLRGAHDRTDLRVAELTRRGRAALGEEAFTAGYAGGWALDAAQARALADPARLVRGALPGPGSAPSIGAAAQARRA